MRLFTSLSTKLLAMISLLTTSNAYADYQFNMPRGVTPLSYRIYDLHMAAFWVCVAIGIVVFGAMIYSLIMHRKSRGYVAAKFHEHPGLEITWAIIPLLILIGLAVPATLTLMRTEDTSDAELNIKITGYQWKWKYEYLDQGISFFSNLSTPMKERQNLAAKNTHYLLEVDNPLVIPVDKKVRFLITANDVIHSWWVPALGIKQDAFPGFIHETWTLALTPGEYRGQCAELCGAGHGFMPIVVVVKTQEDFNNWLNLKTGGKITGLNTDKSAIKLPAQALAATTTNASPTAAPAAKAESAVAAPQAAPATPSTPAKKWTKEELLASGKQVYEQNCMVCHKEDGTGQPPVFPALKGGKIATGPVAEHIHQVLNGKPGTAMQAFGPQLTDDQLAAVVTYERNSFGNNKGDLVQPSDIAAARNKASSTATPPAH